MPPDYIANLSSLQYHLHYRYTGKTVNVSTNTSEILVGSYAYLSLEVVAVSLFTDQLASEWGQFRTQYISPQCRSKGESDWISFRCRMRFRNEPYSV